MCRTAFPCAPSTGPIRSHGLSGRRSIATAQSQDRADALAQLPGGRCLLVPDRSEDPDHVRTRHLRNRHLPDVREGVALQTPQPELRMLGGAPARPQLLPDRPGGGHEGGHRLGPSLLGPGVAPVAGQLPVRERLLARFLERDQGESAEPELGSAATDREALDPAPAARGPHVEIEALAVAVASGLAHVADEGRCQSVVGMPAAGLAFRRSFRECHTYHYTRHEMADARGWSGSVSDKVGF